MCSLHAHVAAHPFHNYVNPPSPPFQAVIGLQSYQDSRFRISRTGPTTRYQSNIALVNEGSTGSTRAHALMR